MALKLVYLEEFGQAFIPKRFIPSIRLYLLKAGINEVPYKFFGILFYLTAAITGMIYIFLVFPWLQEKGAFVLLFGSALSFFGIQLFFATFFILIVYFYTDMLIFKRTQQLEEKLPDFLQIVSSNLKGGMSLENALMKAIKPEFKILASEMAEVSKKVMTGSDIASALGDFGTKYNSPMLRRSIDLIISELKAGGSISFLLDKIVENLKETRVLKLEISAAALSYVIFIGAIVVVVAPLLFALAFNLLSVITGFMSGLAGNQLGGVGNFALSFGDVNVDPVLFERFSLLALSIIAFFASLLVSIVEKGDIKAGLKYIPIFLLGSIAFYVLFLRVLGSVFSGIAG